LLVTLIMPLTPIVLGGAFLSERITLREAIGALVIGAALVIIDGRLVRRARGVVFAAATGRARSPEND
jgi:drug/metabolite transporter (DMT)-like permease